jgi:hypothetical protein
MATNEAQRVSDPPGDSGDLVRFGYVQSLRRTMGPFASFSVAFSMVSITTAIFFLLPSLFGTSGAAGVWLWLPCAGGVFLIVLVYAHLAARIPITGFAYQWNSRLINPHYGWFTGYTALLAFMAGTAATAVALATVFAGDIWAHPSHGDIVLLASAAMVAAAIINIVSIKAVSAVNNVGVVFEILGSVVAAALLVLGTVFFFHHDAGFSILVSTQRTTSGDLWYGFVLAALLPMYCFIGWEGAADLAEETRDPRAVTPRAMIRANLVSMAASVLMIVGFLIAIPKGIADVLGQSQNPLIYIFQTHFGQVAGRRCRSWSSSRSSPACWRTWWWPPASPSPSPATGCCPAPGCSPPSTRAPAPRSPRSCWSPSSASGSTCSRPASPRTSCRSARSPTTRLPAHRRRRRVRALHEEDARAPDRRLHASDAGSCPSPRPPAVFALGVIVIAIAPQEGHTAADYLLGAEAVGLLWYLLYLRPRLRARPWASTAIPRTSNPRPHDLLTYHLMYSHLE